MAQVNQIKDAWLRELSIEMRNRNLSRSIHLGEGFINDRIKSLLNAGQVYTKDEAKQKFNLLFEERSKEIEKHIEEITNKPDENISFVNSMYSALEKQNLPNIQAIKDFMNKSHANLKIPLAQSETL